jgi:predicted RNA-binding Zn-ribbon protein involved in translation (DUF1610 family)
MPAVRGLCPNAAREAAKHKCSACVVVLSGRSRLSTVRRISGSCGAPLARTARRVRFRVPFCRHTLVKHV